MNIKNMLRPFALALGLLFAASSAWAGYASYSTVYILVNPPGNPSYGSGTMNGARFAPDSTQAIGCELYPNSSGGLIQTFCFAQDSAGRYLSCGSSSPLIAQIATSINSTSYVSFTVTNGSCTSLTVENWSAAVR